MSGTGCAGVRGHARSHRGSALAWSGRRTCSSNCLSQNLKPARFTCGSGQAREAGDAVSGTGCAGVRGHARSHRGSALAWSGRRTCSSNCLSQNLKPARFTCRSGQAREAGDAVSGTGCAGVRGHARSHRGSALAWSGRRTCRSNCLSQNLKSLRDSPVGAGKPAKQATRCLAPAAPVFAGMPAPTGGLRWLGVAAVPAGATVFLKI